MRKMMLEGLDTYDRKILRRLSQDGRITWKNLADEIGLSMTPTVRRIRLLEEKGFIKGYFARLDEALLIGPMIVFISVTLERQTREILERFEEAVSRVPVVISGFLMSGGADYLLRAAARDLDHYRDILEDLTQIDGVAHIQSSFALKAFVNRSAPLIDDHA